MMDNPYAINWGVHVIPGIVTDVTFRGLDWRAPTMEEVVKASLEILERRMVDNPFFKRVVERK